MGMNKLPFLVLLLIGSTAFSDEHGELIFEDDFERIESQETEDEPGNGWETNSRTRAKGNKQVDLDDGAMRIFIHEEADHAVSVRQPVAFTNGAVALKFLLEDKRDSLGLNFADLKEKSVHAGHLFVVKIGPKRLDITDLKTGNMKLTTREARVAGTLSADQKKALADKQARFPVEVSVGEWHDLLVEIEGDMVRVTLDGEEAGQFASEGITHPTKRLLRLAVPRQAVVDDVRVWRKK